MSEKVFVVEFKKENPKEIIQDVIDVLEAKFVGRKVNVHSVDKWLYHKKTRVNIE